MRYLCVTLFIALYILLGYLLSLGVEGYLLIGIPLTVTFQVFVAKKPIYKLWVRDAQKFSLDKSGWLITLFFLVYPVYKTAFDLTLTTPSVTHLGYDMAAVIGAFCAGFCYSKLTRKSGRDLVICFSITALVRISLYFLPLLTGRDIALPGLVHGIQSLLIYIPVAFVVEEVVFRGMLDSFVHQVAGKSGLFSAFFISILWGLWHLPISNNENGIWLVIARSFTISLWGIILSIFWRRTGNLAVPGFSHAFADAVRDSFK